MTQRTFLLLTLAGGFAFAGCGSGGLSLGGDGGVDCVGLDEVSCKNKNSLSCVADYCSACSCTPTYVGCRLASSPKTVCPAFGCPVPNCSCTGLGEQACIAAESTMSCVPSYCPDCHGGQTFQSCGTTHGTGACPLLCANGCRQPADCSSSGQLCLAPGAPLCGGACRVPPACTDDAFCQASGGGSGMVCDYPTCSCGGPKKGCIPGCTQPSDCPAGQMCSATHHCVAFPCGQCPAHFVCSAATGDCTRQTCKVDGDCGTGFCVEGGCYDSLGTCTFPPG